MVAGVNALGNQNRDPGARETSNGADIGLVYKAYDDVRFLGKNAPAHLQQVDEGKFY
jgi:hypothetical protein